MATILPSSSTLPQIQEGGAVSQTFTYSLGANESLVSIKISKYDSMTGIKVSGATYSGTYSNVFTLDKDSLKYRTNDSLKTASSWDDLPKDADLYEWKAPTNLKKTVNYTVELVYNTTSTTTPVTTTKSTITKNYSQLVYGNWDVWADKLRKFVYARG